MSHTVQIRKGILLACLFTSVGSAFGAVSQATLRSGPIADESAFHSALRQQHQLDREDGAMRCEAASVNEAVALIYQTDDVPGALAIARRCELLAITQGRAEQKTLASRIKALVAIKTKDMPSLQAAGEALVSAAQNPESIADGHLFIAFSCTFSGRAACARTHLDHAKAMFSAHEVAGALEQLMSVEQALLKLEASPSP